MRHLLDHFQDSSDRVSVALTYFKLAYSCFIGDAILSEWTELNIYICVVSFTYLYLTHFRNTLRLRQHGRHFADDTFKCIFLNENVWIPIKISLKFVPKGPINNIPALVQIMAWRRPGDNPLSEPMMVGLPTHICVTRPQWVNKSCLFRPVLSP